MKIRNARYDGAVMLTHRDGALHVQPSSECPACIALRTELAALLGSLFDVEPPRPVVDVPVQGVLL